MRSCLKMFALVLLALATVSWAKVVSKSNDIVVVEPKDLPAAAQAGGESMTLYSANNGQTYLYLEQQQLHRLLVLDVTDPARIKEVATVGLDAPAPFRFGERIGFSAALVRFEDGHGAGVMSFANPKQPKLTQVGTALVGADADSISPDVFLARDGSAVPEKPFVRDYRVMESSDPGDLRLLTTVKGVRKAFEKSDTGTTFLLGQDGLTVIRQPRVELKNLLESTYAS